MQPGVYRELYQRLMNKLFRWIEGFVELLPNTVAAVLLLLAFWLASVVIVALVRRGLERMHTDRAAARLVVTLVRLIVLGAGLFGALDLLGLDKALTSLLAGAGIIGLALGFAFQDLAANLIAGIALAIARKRPFQVGDLLETNGFVGTVQHVGLRTTYLGTLDGKTIVIPNKHIYQTTLVNLSVSHQRRVDLTLAVDRAADLTRVTEVTRAALESIQPRLSEPSPRVYFRRFTESAVELTGWFWIDFSVQEDLLRAEHAAVTTVHAAFREAKIELAFPVRTLQVKDKASFAAPPQ